MRLLLAAVLAAACTSTNPCGDLVLYSSGLEVHVTGPVDATTDYAISIDADGNPLTLHSQTAYDAATTLADGRTLRAQVSTVTQLDNSVELDVIVQLEQGDETGPSSETLTVSDASGPLGQATFTPTYVHSEPDGPACPSYDYAQANMSLTP